MSDGFTVAAIEYGVRENAQTGDRQEGILGRVRGPDGELILVMVEAADEEYSATKERVLDAARLVYAGSD